MTRCQLRTRGRWLATSAIRLNRDGQLSPLGHCVQGKGHILAGRHLYIPFLATWKYFNGDVNY